MKWEAASTPRQWGEDNVARGKKTVPEAEKEKEKRARAPRRAESPSGKHATRVVDAEAERGRKELKVDTDLEWLRDGAGAVNRREVEAVTERVFDSVLARHGWVRNQRGHLEHVGEEIRS